MIGLDDSISYLISQRDRLESPKLCSIVPSSCLVEVEMERREKLIFHPGWLQKENRKENGDAGFT